ncbi:transcriptional regulator, IclR family [Geodermatophilus telluris]|uniref:Transcriptional regulator, IclR family n=1 Tax=Geodermatophilus telluris TaxID=1190417 RepID=A0A1G6QMF6_9ACTN|nr:IclR family transcriptional regulator [Geodermatophilus telluris]SDC93234.1 transcriptional regulator, IclR family [Geodermatophilus telluris]
MASAAEGAKLNQSVRKAITLLRATAEDRDANVSSLARSAGLPRATALRMIQTLEQEGFLLRIPGDDRVLLGPELLRLARGTDEQLLLREVARPVIGDLVAAVRETVTLSVVAPDGGLDLVSQVDAPAQLRPQSWVGQRFPLHASASGKVLLAAYDEERLERFLLEPLPRFTPATITTAEALRAELEHVREQRYAVARDEEEEGLAGIATEIHGPGNELLGVLTVGGPTQRLDRQRGRHAVDHLLRAAGQVEAVLRRGRASPTVLEVIARTGG